MLRLTIRGLFVLGIALAIAGVYARFVLGG